MNKVKSILIEGNEKYLADAINTSDISSSRRNEITKNGQKPYAIILTCSDSRVPPEHIFSAGIGDLFVVRNAGNIVSDNEIGSIEFAVQYLSARAILVLGHTKCAAVAAAINGKSIGKIQKIIDHIKPIIGNETESCKCENLNILNSFKQIKKSYILSKLISTGELEIYMAKYDVETGKVKFLDDLEK